MKKQNQSKNSNTLVKSIQKKYGVALSYSSDEMLHKSLRESGLPSLSKLLKMVHKKAA